jgi:opacity protein-like surface antigen
LTEADLTLEGDTSKVEISVDAVPSGSAAIGYRFQSFPYRAVDARIEIQGGASESEPDTIEPRGALADRAGTTAKQDGFDADNLHSIYGMVNLWIDYPFGTSWVVSAGGGLGAAYIDWDNAGCCGLGVILDDSDVVFAYQLGAAVGYEVIQDLVIGLDYRYFATADPEFNYNGNWSSEYGAHDLMFSFRYFAF